MYVAANQPFDGTLNTIGHIAPWEFGEIEPDQPYTSGRGYSGAEGYECVLPWHLTSRKSGAE